MHTVLSLSKQSLSRLMVFCLVFGSIHSFSKGQTDTLSDSVFFASQPNRKRLQILVIGTGTAYAATLTGLNALWYADSPRSPFHFFNDNREWQQIDKVGHFYTAYHIGRLGAQAFEWTGMPHRKSIWRGALMGMVFQTPIEILDGFSSAYGASWGDLTANTIGSGLLIGQVLLWNGERIHPKFSFYPTALARLRPNLLGENLLEQALKDYNGQTYWLAFQVKPFLKAGTKFPDWLCVSLGYGTYNMVAADKHQSRLSGYQPYRQWYLSLDIDFTKIRTKSRLLKNLFFWLNSMHIPAPALEWNPADGLKAHPLYF